MKLDARSYVFRAIVLATLLFVASVFAVAPDEKAGAPQADKDTNPRAEDVSSNKSLWIRTLNDAPGFWTAVLAGLTFVLAGVGVGQIYFLIRADETTRVSANAAKASADIARATLVASQRAWIKVTLSYDELCHLTVIADQLNVGVRFAIENVGNSIAQDIFISLWLYVRADEDTTIAWRDAKCEEIRIRDNRSRWMLFPGQKYEVPNGTWGTAAPYERVEAGLAYGRKNGENGFIVSVIGCITYRFPTDRTFHQTRFAYNFGGNAGSFIGLDELQPGTRFRFEPMPFGGGEYAD